MARTFADDLLGQTSFDTSGTMTGSPSYSNVHSDGLGSARILTDAGGAITDSWEYEAYGNEIAHSGETPFTNLFRGQQFDRSLGFYYLRVRWLNVANGRFTQADRWQGDVSGPPSLNKYLFADSSPIENWDPSGFYSQKFGYLVEVEVERQYRISHPECSLGVGFPCFFGVRQYVNPLRYLKPDVMNWRTNTFLEVKPFSLSGIYKGAAQLGAYTAAYGGLFDFKPDVIWTPAEAIIEGDPTYFINAGGIILYTDDDNIARKWIGATAATAAAIFRANALRTATRVGADAVARAALNVGLRIISAVNAGRISLQASLVVTTRI